MKLALQIILLLGSEIMFAQTANINIDADYDSIPFLKFADEIEAKHPVKFYFDKSLFDSVFIVQREQKTTLSAILDDSFRDLGLNYLMDGPNILITRNYKIFTALPRDFFIVDNDADNSPLDSIDLRYAFIEQASQEESNGGKSIISIGDPANR